MPKYLCIRRSDPNRPMRSDKPSPAQMEAMYAQFNTWKEKFQQNIVDLGGRLTNVGRVLSSEGVADGPFVEAKEVVGGFMILTAKDLEEAAEVARQCPGAVMPGGSLEIREFNTP